MSRPLCFMGGVALAMALVACTHGLPSIDGAPSAPTVRNAQWQPPPGVERREPAASRRPLGVAVVGGMALSQLVTLYVTQLFYTYLDEFQTWFGTRGVRRAEARRTAGEIHAV